MFNVDQELGKLADVVVLCVGDLMLDDFVYGDVARISPEAPTPVIRAKRSDLIVGGAGNVARNIAGIDASCIFVGVVGDDEAGRILQAALAAEPRIEASLVVGAGRPTTRKVRFVSEHYSTHLLRADWETSEPVSAAMEQEIIGKARAALPRAGAVILSDYAKGVLTPNVVRAVIEAATRAGVPVIVDPKGNDYALYRGATLVTPNRKELAEVVHRAVEGDADVVAAAREVCQRVACEGVLVTRSDEGLSLIMQGRDAVHVPAYPVKIRDVSGAGDTVVAVMSAMLAAGADFESAMRTANAAAAVVVGKPGTATLSFAELRAQLLPASSLAPESKIFFDWAQLDERLSAWRRQGLRIGFTNGCFDILHPGHVRLLTQARAACDRLVLGLNSDASVRRLKGESRPVQDMQARAEVLAALEAVDLVVIFEEDTPQQLIERVRPKVLVKGADYTRDQVVGGAFVEADGGEIVLVDLVPGQSTSNIVSRSRGAAKA